MVETEAYIITAQTEKLKSEAEIAHKQRKRKSNAEIMSSDFDRKNALSISKML